MALIVIDKSVGRRGQNFEIDVVKIAGALVVIGPDRGGIFGPPLSPDGLAQAIESFQRFHRLPVKDGKVDPRGKTLGKINEILEPGLAPPKPAPAPTPAGTGVVRPMGDTGALAKTVSKNTWTPVEASLSSELVFQWSGVSGKGKIAYFELDETVVPRWFGVLIPDGVTSFDKANIFFHPTPGQAGFKDKDYHARANWPEIFHYLSDDMAAQFCAAGTDRVLFMPLMTQGAAEGCGMFPQRWESIVGRILGMLKSGDMTPSAKPASISSVVVSSFSSGITYSHHFRLRAGLGSRLAGVIDFDGAISSYSHHSAAIRSPAGRVVRMQQMPATKAMLGPLAAQNIFPLGSPRWGKPWEGVFSKDPKTALLQIHGTIPQTAMFVAARRAG